jgi:hypothetical protein
MVAGGLLASAGYAQADASAAGSGTDSPGVVSGSTAQAPLSLPINLCDNTLDLLGLINPAISGACAGDSGAAAAGTAGSGSGTAVASGSGTTAEQKSGAQVAGISLGSTHVLTGTTAQVPVHVPVNISGNSVNVGNLGNPSSGGSSGSGSTPAPAAPRKPATPPPPSHTPVPAPPNEPQTTTTHQTSLAHTGARGLGWAAGGGAALLLCGAVLVRRFRTSRSTRR